MTETYLFKLRANFCKNCDAPVSSRDKTEIKCEYCNTINTFKLNYDEFFAPITQSIPNDANEYLKQIQDQKDDTVAHPNIEQLLQNNEIVVWKIEEAFYLWKSLKEKLSNDNEHQFLQLTYKLAQFYKHNNSQEKERALLETALELVKSSSSIQIIYGWFSQNAAMENDLENAKKWFSLMTPYPPTREAFSSYHICAILIKTLQKNYDELLLSFNQQRPFHSSHFAWVATLHANVLENLNEVDKATQILNNYLEQLGLYGKTEIESIINTSKRFNLILAPKSFNKSIKTNYKKMLKFELSAIKTQLKIVLITCGSILGLASILLGVFLRVSWYWLTPVLVFAILLLFFLSFMVWDYLVTRRILRSGVEGIGRINSASPGRGTCAATGRPNYNLNLEVTLKGYNPFQIDIMTAIDQVNFEKRFNISQIVYLEADPKNFCRIIPDK